MTRMSTINMKVPECLKDNTDQKAQNSGRRTLIIVSAVFCGICLVSGITLAAVYFGSHLTRKAYEGQVTLHTADGETIKENIVVREAEVEITEPGKLSIINDYGRLLSVFKFDDGSGLRCYLSRLNTSIVGTRQDMINRINAKGVFLSPVTIEFSMSETDMDAPAPDLGDNAWIMCKGLDLHWLTPTLIDDGDAVRNKRQVELSVSIKLKIKF